MIYTKIKNKLFENKDIFKNMLKNASKEEYLWKPQPEKWCLLEIVCHLHDEEREDFRRRIKGILENPLLPLPPINPPAWVTERKYMEQDYAEMLDKFLQEREASVAWLHSLDNPKWSNAYQHPQLGSLTAKMFLANWLAHDYLHIRQITKLKHDFLKDFSGEKLDYAGGW